MQLWPDPRDGLDAGDAPWNWVPVGIPLDGGATKKPPNLRPGWRRWYFIYRKPDGTKIKISADRDPDTGQWFNPHASSEQP